MKKIACLYGGFFPRQRCSSRNAATTARQHRKGCGRSGGEVNHTAWAARWVLALCLVFCQPGVAGGEERQYHINLPAQSVAEALKSLSEQTNAPVFFSYQLANTRNANPVSGRYTLQQAVDILLEGTGLSGDLTQGGVITISQAPSNESETEKMNSENRKKSVLASIVAFFTSVGAGVNASAEEVGSGQGVSQGEAYVLEEIIVTASKRKTNLQDTPMSISALGAEAIDKRGLVSMDDYLRTMAGVDFQDRGASQNNVTIRGLASDPQAEDPTVGIYFGETPVTGLGSNGVGDLSGNADIKLVDIERIEVLRGPQGTLYGSGSMGGTVRVIPAAPNLTEFEGKVAARYSNTDNSGSDNTMIQSVINLPVIADTLAIRAVAYRFDNGGYIENVATTQAAAVPGVAAGIANSGVAKHDDDVGSDEYTGFRIAALWRPVENLDITLSYLNQDIEQNGFPEVNTTLAGDFQQVRLRTGPGGSHSEHLANELDISNLLIEYDAGWASIVSSTSLTDYESVTESDLSLIFGAPEFAPNSENTEVLVEELRLNSQFDGPFQFIAGAYYEDNDVKRKTPWAWSGDPDLDPGVHLVGQRGIVTKQFAVFGEVSYDITDQLTLTVGARHFDMEQDLVSESGVSIGGVITATQQSASTEEKNQTYKAHLAYTPNDDTLLYLQWAEGFRLGRAIGLRPATCEAELNARGLTDRPGVDSDTSESYELGGKFSFYDNRVTVNAAIYRINWDGMPVGILLPSCNSTLIVNAGKSLSQGVELETSAQLTDNLRANLSLSYNEAYLTEDAPKLGSDGDDLPGSADFNAGIGLEYSFNMFDREAFLRGDYAYVGDYFSNIAKTGDPAGDYHQLNLKAGVQLNQVDVDLFVNNVTNEDAFTWAETTFSTFGFSRAYRLRPRTFGVNVGYHF